MAKGEGSTDNRDEKMNAESGSGETCFHAPFKREISFPVEFRESVLHLPVRLTRPSRRRVKRRRRASRGAQLEARTSSVATSPGTAGKPPHGARE